MRPTANFALHALAAIMLTAFATTSAAAAADYYLKLGDIKGEAAGKEKWIEIQGWDWGRTAKVDSLTIKQSATDGAKGGNVEFEWKVEEGESAPPGDPDRPIVAGTVPNPAVGANEKLTVGGARTETASGQATGKRQHMPIRTRTTYDAPLAKGSVWVRVSTPWAACRVGARYPSLELGGGAKRYVLQDVTVASCGGSGDADDRPTEEVAFYYNRIAFNYAKTPDAKVQVRGWDPKKKEE